MIMDGATFGVVQDSGSSSVDNGSCDKERQALEDGIRNGLSQGILDVLRKALLQCQSDQQVVYCSPLPLFVACCPWN